MNEYIFCTKQSLYKWRIFKQEFLDLLGLRILTILALPFILKDGWKKTKTMLDLAFLKPQRLRNSSQGMYLNIPVGSRNIFINLETIYEDKKRKYMKEIKKTIIHEDWHKMFNEGRFGLTDEEEEAIIEDWGY